MQTRLLSASIIAPTVESNPLMFLGFLLVTSVSFISTFVTPEIASRFGSELASARRLRKRARLLGRHCWASGIPLLPPEPVSQRSARTATGKTPVTVPSIAGKHSRTQYVKGEPLQQPDQATSEEPCRRVSKFYRRGNRIKPPEHMLTLWLRRRAPIVYPLRYPSSPLRSVA